MTLAEPTTTLTDLLLALVAAWLVWRLLRRRQPGDRAALFWILALAVNGLAAATGGVFHGFIESLPPAVAGALWLLTLQAVGLASALLVAGPLVAWVAPPSRRWLLAVAAVVLAAYAVQVTLEPIFLYAVLVYLPALLLTGGLAGWQYRKTRARGAAWLGISVVLGIVGAMIQRTEFVWHQHFNANDLFHLFQLAGTCCYYRAARGVLERVPTSAGAPATECPHTGRLTPA
jgi:hypothetical protein